MMMRVLVRTVLDSDPNLGGCCHYVKSLSDKIQLSYLEFAVVGNVRNNNK
jgi:hypothetical protein